MTTSSKTPFELRSVLLSSERLPEPVELRNIVVDLDIFEHLEKPYMTGQMVLVDDTKIYEDADILGGEQIIITVSSTEETAKAITKTFRIAQVDNTQKINDNSQAILFHLIEEHGYISNLLNVNRFYTGQPSAIIQKISNNYLNMMVHGIIEDEQVIKCIVPNLTPIDAMKWLAQRATTPRGYPYYLFSTLVGDHIHFHDLGTLLSEPPLNGSDEDAPFMVSAVTGQSTMDQRVQKRIIKNHKFSTQENLMKLINHGVIGAQYEIVDTINEGTKTFRFDANEDLFKRLIEENVMTQAQQNPPYSAKFMYNDRSFHELNSRIMSMVGGSGAYRTSTDPTFFNSYSEANGKAEYKLGIISKAMSAVMKKNPLTINVDGQDFLHGDVNKTVGNNIRIHFHSTSPEAGRDAGDDGIDKKKSGDYLIYSTRHMFKQSVQKYEMTATCVKIGNYKRLGH